MIREERTKARTLILYHERPGKDGEPAKLIEKE